MNWEIADASSQQLFELKEMVEKITEAYSVTAANQEAVKRSHTTSKTLDELAQQMSGMMDLFNTEQSDNELTSKAA